MASWPHGCRAIRTRCGFPKAKEPAERLLLLGKRIPGVDNKEIFNGSLIYGCDTRLDGMVYAVFQKCPSFGGKVRRANVEQIKSFPGVVDAFG